jgi:lipopolysaccharide transport system permease protein
VSSATNCIMANAALVKKVVFPRHIIPISVVLSQIIHLVIQLALLGLFLILFQVPVTRLYLWVPLALLVEIVFILGVTLIFSALNVYFRDIEYLVQSGMVVLFWFTPIFYTMATARERLTASFSPRLYTVFLLNPLVGCVDAIRQAILYHSAPEPVSFLVACVVAAAMLVLGVFMFGRLHRDFADFI